ncbi:hypothetical protein C8R45DRAFT_1094757 [Mycena sanguinolenta]|nr:hypothetical protein C8R45DRAFT_1094757 [Mycena sanguinolenta]
MSLTDVTCNILVKGATNGIQYGYISPVLNPDGYCANFQAQAGALCVILVLRDPAHSAQLAGVKRPRCGPDTEDAASLVVLGNENLVLRRPNYTSVPLGLTCATSPSGTPRVFSDENSHSAAAPVVERTPHYIESAIWCYDPATHALTPQWINPQQGDEPETSIILAESAYFPRRYLGLTGDVEGGIKPSHKFTRARAAYTLTPRTVRRSNLIRYGYVTGGPVIRVPVTARFRVNGLTYRVASHATLCAIAQLRCTVFFSTSNSFEGSPLQADSRFMCIEEEVPYYFDWLQGVVFGENYWSLADAFLAARKAGDT